MIKHLITATLFVLGCTGVGLVGYLATEPLAFTQPVRLGFTQRVKEVPPLAPEPPTAVLSSISSDPEPATNAVWLAEVQITGTVPRARKRAAPPLVPARFDPRPECRNTSALAIDPAGAAGVRNVRPCCDEPELDR